MPRSRVRVPLSPPVNQYLTSDEFGGVLHRKCSVSATALIPCCIAVSGSVPLGWLTLFPFHQTYDVALRACCAEVSLVGGDQYTVGSFKRNSMIVAVKEMLFELHCKLHSPA